MAPAKKAEFEIDPDCGIVNTGTTCWMSSILHVLASMPRLRREIYHLELPPPSQQSDLQRFVETLQVTLHRLHRTNEARINKIPICISELVEAAHKLEPSMFHNDRHEDASKHLIKMLEFLERLPTANRILNSFTAKTTATARTRRVFTIHLPLSSVHFYDCLEDSFKSRVPKNTPKEKIDDYRVWIEKLPDVLLVPINRSKVNMTKTRKNFAVLAAIALDRHLVQEKKNALEIFKKKDSRRIFLEEGPRWAQKKYFLTAVLMHTGERTDVGHNTAYVLDHSPDAHDKFWFYDDEMVSRKDICEIRNDWSGLGSNTTSSATMLVYSKFDVLEDERQLRKDADLEEMLYSDSMKKAIAAWSIREEYAARARVKAEYARAVAKSTSRAKWQLSEEDRRRHRAHASAYEGQQDAHLQYARLASFEASNIIRGMQYPFYNDKFRKISVKRKIDSGAMGTLAKKSRHSEEEKESEIETSPDTENVLSDDEISGAPSSPSNIDEASPLLYDSSRVYQKHHVYYELFLDIISDQQRSEAVELFLEDSEALDNELYPEPTTDEFCRKKIDIFIKHILTAYVPNKVYKGKNGAAMNAVARREKQRLLVRESLWKIPEDTLPPCFRDLHLSKHEFQLCPAIEEIVQWFYDQRNNLHTDWISNALFFSLFVDGYLSPAGTVRIIAEALKVNYKIRSEYLNDIFIARPSSLLRVDYILNRYDIFLVVVHNYADVISHWRHVYGTRKRFEAAAREVENVKKNLTETYVSYVSKLLAVLRGLQVLMEGMDREGKKRVRDCFLSDDQRRVASFSRVAALAYAFAVSRLLHASRKMHSCLRVETGALKMADKAQAAVAKAELGYIRSFLRGIYELKLMLQWWQTLTQIEIREIPWTVEVMDKQLEWAAKNLGVGVNFDKVNAPSCINTDCEWRTTAVKNGLELLQSGELAAWEEDVCDAFGSFPSLIKTLFNYEKQTQFAPQERTGASDYDD